MAYRRGNAHSFPRKGCAEPGTASRLAKLLVMSLSARNAAKSRLAILSLRNSVIVSFINMSETWTSSLYSSPLKHPLRHKQWLLRHEMTSLHEIDCFLCWCAHEKWFLKALLINECLKNELYISIILVTSTSLNQESQFHSMLNKGPRAMTSRIVKYLRKLTYWMDNWSAIEW